jgi:pyruvate dehydrogenase E2 component (dihydrolipoamide acetyltransferase)
VTQTVSAGVVDVTMPRLSDSMEEATILRWLKATGEAVERGEEIVEVETDKATMPYEAEESGVLEVIAAEGDTVALGGLIARLHPAGTTLPDSGAATAGGEATTPGEPPAALSNGGDARPKASPLARRVAAALGIDLATLTGTGPRGRILKTDVEAAADAPNLTPAIPQFRNSAIPAARPAPRTETAVATTTTEQLSRLQRTVAERMSLSKSTAPDFVLNVDIDMTNAVALREQLRASSDGDPDTPLPTYNDLVVKASALALREYPRANGTYKDDHFELHEHVNVGIAVAAENALIVPVIDDADTKSIGQIARDARALATKVRDGAITPRELEGGTFTVSNLGMFGITSFTAIVNPPQAGILAVGAVEDRIVAKDGQPAVQPTMTATLTADHRILYGADAAQFLGRIKTLLEAPARLLFS